jgi:hypothetical protein
LIEANGFTNIVVQKQKPVTLPDDILNKYLDEEGLAGFRNGNTGIFSVTIYAEKPVVETSACCGTDCCK